MITTGPIPDALMVPEKLKRGRTLFDRINSILDIAEPILCVDRSMGERAYIRRQQDGFLFITRHPADTIYWPLGSALQGRPRYHWFENEDRIRRGYLTPEAQEAAIHARREGEA